MTNYKNASILLGILVFLLFTVMVLQLFKAENRNTTEVKCYEITESDIKQVKCN